MKKPEIIRSKELPKLLGISRQTIWRLEKNGQFVPKIYLSSSTRGYRLSDIENWINTRMQENDSPEE